MIRKNVYIKSILDKKEKTIYNKNKIITYYKYIIITDENEILTIYSFFDLHQKYKIFICGDYDIYAEAYLNKTVLKDNFSMLSDNILDKLTTDYCDFFKLLEALKEQTTIIKYEIDVNIAENVMNKAKLLLDATKIIEHFHLLQIVLHSDTIIEMLLDNIDTKDYSIFFNADNTYKLLKYEYKLDYVKKLDKHGFYKNHHFKRTTYLIYYFLKNEYEKGNICFNLNNLTYLKKSIYINDIKISDKEVNEAIKDDEFVIFNNHLYIKKNFYIEQDLCENIAQRIKNENIKYINDVKFNNLTDEQNRALNNCLQNRISILSGGPGTGKTYTIKSIIKYINENYKDKKILVASLTGRVANKIKEDVNINDKNIRFLTIHSALNLNLFKKNNILNTIEDDYLIIDEASMIDINLFKYIFLHTNFYTHILLSGDFNQIESINAGQVFKDLINSKKIKTTYLSKIFRQKKGNSIISNAYKILNNAKSKDLKRDNHFYIINDFNEKYINEITNECITCFIKQRNVKLNDITILTATKDRAKIINTLVQKQNKNYESIIINKRLFKKFDKVIHTKNNRILNVFNGEIGYVREINNNSIIVSYKQKDIIYDKSNISQLELAYAITIHKAQGSEAKHVFVVLSKTDRKMLNRNLLYTAITRAKQTVVIIAKEEVLNKAIQQKSNERTSNISDRLKDFMSNKKEN